MVILGSKSKDGDMTIRLCQFIISNQPPRGKLVALCHKRQYSILLEATPPSDTPALVDSEGAIGG